jgi:truncated hemoglobin YjbI
MTTPSAAAKFFGDLAQTHYQAIGGTREALLGVTTAFYSRVLADPILTVLFKSKGPEHAQRLMLFMLYFMEVSGASGVL